MLTVTYKTLHGLAPTHIKDLLQSYLAAEDLRASKKKNLLAVRAFNVNSYGRRARFLLLRRFFGTFFLSISGMLDHCTFLKDSCN